MESSQAPNLSTPAEHIFEDATPVTILSTELRLSEEQLYIQYEIQRTIDEIREGGWKRIALQFPDEMLVDAPRVLERLRDGLRLEQRKDRTQTIPDGAVTVSEAAEVLQKTTLDGHGNVEAGERERDLEAKLYILADTSYGACCVDEVAAEHVDAEVVVHYGRACLSPTARLPVIYVFTTKPLDLDAAVMGFEVTYEQKDTKVCLMADIPYCHHVPELHQKLREAGYENLFATEIVRDPSSLLPNRTLPQNVRQNLEALKEYSIFHISSPPTSLLLILSSRVKNIHILPTDTPHLTTLQASTAAILRRRYALITHLSTVPIFGILINTLSVSNYLAALQHCQDLISRAGKKSYVFVVGKVNATKVANFAEIGGWIVIGCWESSLIESKDFYRPVITPFELEIALMGDEERLWGGEWVGDFSALIGRETAGKRGIGASEAVASAQVNGSHDRNWNDEPSDDEPPDFDLRTGRYVSRTRPIPRPKPDTPSSTAARIDSVPPSSALVQRAKGDIATINGAVSPAAEFFRSQRMWQGLGSDHEISYERDEDGRIRGAAMEEGSGGVAKGYAVGGEGTRS